MPRPGIPDPFRMRARAEGYVARAIYKLKEIDEKYRLFREGIRVLDLGCSPGSWLQYLAARVGPRLPTMASAIFKTNIEITDNVMKQVTTPIISAQN